MSESGVLGREVGPRAASTPKPYVVLAMLGVVPVVALAVYAHRLASVSMERHIEASNRNAAEITRELVEHDFAHWVDTLEGFARMPGFVSAVGEGDEEGVRRRLGILVAAKPRVVRAFVTDTEGRLWSDHPRAPESLGRRFDHRDWYRGLSRSWQPYVSRVYRRHAAPKPLLVAVAAPVRATSGGPVLGAVVYQVRLEGLTDMLRRVKVGGSGHVFLTDHSGVVAAHPGLDLQDRVHDEYAGTGLVQAVLAGARPGSSYTDPSSGERMLCAALPCDVQGQRWVVVAQQPGTVAYEPIRTLAWQIAGAGLLLAVVVGGLCFGLAAFHNRVRTMNRKLGESNERLAHENDVRLRTEQELQRSHEDLERRVEERTRELRQKEEQLLHAQKMEAVGRMAGGIAHDFNNLLSVIVGYGELVVGGLPRGAPFRKEIEAMRDAGERGGKLTRQLLAFSRRQVLQPRPIDLNRIVADMDMLLRRIIGEDIDLVTRPAPRLDAVMADPGQVEQIVANLVVNARDAMPEGGKLTVVTANVLLDEDYARTHADARPGPHVMLAITDTGIGMDEETRARIFDPFYTTKGIGRGTGLGLSTVYGIVKQSGGNIWVYSEVGRGTTFKVYLPAVREQPETVERRQPETALPPATETVLVVEDEPAVRTLIVSVLRSQGHTVLEAAEADGARALAERHGGVIHLLLTDVILPGCGGPELAEILAASRPGMRVLFMSGYTDDAIVHHGVLEEGVAFLDKPIHPGELVRTVRETLAGDG